MKMKTGRHGFQSSTRLLGLQIDLQIFAGTFHADNFIVKKNYM